jgi:putative tricarboxylic transport membrane protein
MSIREYPGAGRVCRRLLASAWLLGIAATCAAQPAGWAPQRTVELVVGSGAGGPLDVTARTVQKIWRERKIVEANTAVLNKPGGGGVLGFKYLNDHPGDGHYLAVTSTTLLTNDVTGASALRYTDLTPIAVLFSEYVAFGVRTDAGLTTAADLVRTLRSAPASISISIASVLGNHNHIGAAALTKKAGGDVRDLKIVVNKSSGESVTVLLGGHVDVAAATASNFVGQMQAGKVRVLGVAAPARLGGALAQVPTLKEQGQDVVVGAWRGVVGPRGMSPAQIAYWENAFARLVQSEDWKAELEKRYYRDTFMKHAETARHFEAERAQLRVILTELGLAK